MRKTFFAVASALIAGMVASQTVQLLPVDQEVEGSYTNNRGDRAELIGVCHITENSVTCWGPKGEPHPKLEERMAAALNERASSNSYVSFRYRAKNRVLVFRTASRGYNLRFETNRSNQNGYNNVQLHDKIEDAPSDVNIQHTLLNLAFEPEAKSTFVDISESVPTSVIEPFALKEGVSFEADGVKITLGKIPKGVKANLGYGQAVNWAIPVSVESPLKANLQMSCGLFGPDGKPIMYASSEGKPLSAKDLAVMQMQRTQGGMYVPPITSYLTLALGATTGQMTVSVDPKYVHRVHTSVTKQRTIRMINIPLEPVSRN